MRIHCIRDRMWYVLACLEGIALKKKTVLYCGMALLLSVSLLVYRQTIGAPVIGTATGPEWECLHEAGSAQHIYPGAGRPGHCPSVHRLFPGRMIREYAALHLAPLHHQHRVWLHQ